MSIRSYQTRHRLAVELLTSHGPVPLVAELQYDASDPYAVGMAFLREGDEVRWYFARDLLLRGVSEPVGDGDVKVFPSVAADGRAMVVIALKAPTGQALVEARTGDVLEFLATTVREVWPGTERDHQRGTDEAIAALLVED
jgi:hypothetical protein